MYSSCLMLRVSEIEHKDSNLLKIQKLVAETDEMAAFSGACIKALVEQHKIIITIVHWITV